MPVLGKGHYPKPDGTPGESVSTSVSIYDDEKIERVIKGMEAAGWKLNRFTSHKDKVYMHFLVKGKNPMKHKKFRRKSGKKKFRLYRRKSKRGHLTLAAEIKAAAKRRGYRIKSVKGLMAKFTKRKRRSRK